MIAKRLDGNCSVRGQPGPDATLASLPAQREATWNSTQRLLHGAGLCSGHRILNLGTLLRDRDMPGPGLGACYVLALREEADLPVERQLRSVNGTGHFCYTVSNIDDLDLPDASFDAVVALDWWPTTSLAVAVRPWRRILHPAGGIVVLRGTDIPAIHGSPRRASQQWLDELTSAGFTIDAVATTSTEPSRYAGLAGNAWYISESLRAALGAELTDSYLTHVELLNRVVQEGSTRRFEIIAKVYDAR